MKPEKLLIFWLAFTVSLITGAHAQSPARGVVEGQLADSAQGAPVEGATVTLYTLADSIVAGVVPTDRQGSFRFQQLPAGAYLLQISAAGFENRWLQVTLGSPHWVYQAGKLWLQPKAHTLATVVVQNTPIAIKGDTTDISVAGFKTAPNASTEDLLKKLPGLEVEKDGTIKSQGQRVTRILVDGKRFFGNDPKMATRNLPAEIIDRVQVIDARSEQSAFSGFDDGERVQTLNIITKKDKKKGLFGKATVAAGPDARHSHLLSANSFKNNRQLSIIGQWNNVSNQQFTIQDFLGTVQGNTVKPGTAGFSPLENGVSATRAAGINYNNTWGRGTRLNASYFHDDITTTYNRNRFRETFFTGDSSLFNTHDSRTINGNKNHRLNMELEQALDSFTFITLRPELRWQYNDNEQSALSASTRGQATKLNTVENLLHTQSNGYDLNNTISFRHRFAKTGRSISASLVQRFNTNDWYRDNLAYTYRTNGKTDTLDQQSTNIRDGKTLGANLSVTEPISKKSQLELTYHYTYNRNDADQYTSKYNPASGVYDMEVANLTNQFRNTSQTQRAGLNYRLQWSKELNLAAGLAVQQAGLGSINLSRKTQTAQDYSNLLPNLHINYRKGRKESLRLGYRGLTRLPSITQLQDVLDNSRVLFIRAGNPNLKPEYVHELSFRYNRTNPATLQQLSINVNASLVQNSIANTYTINNTTDTMVLDGYKLGPGVQYSKFRNVDGALVYSSGANYSFPVNAAKNALLHLGARLSMNREVNLINQAWSRTNNFDLNGTVKFTRNFNERLDLVVHSQTQYNLARYAAYSVSPASFLVQRLSLEPVYNTRNGWIFGHDLEYILYRGQANGAAQSLVVWNCYLSKLFLKNRQAELKLSVFDLLDQNTSITRNIEQNYREDLQTEVQRRYVLLGFTWHLKRFAAPAKKRVG